MAAIAGLHSLARRGEAAGTAGFTLLADLLFPRRCGVCGRFGAFLCAPCRDELPVLPSSVSAPVAGIDLLAAPCAFEGSARLLVHRLKYERLSALAEPMAQVMIAAWPRLSPSPGATPLAVPVPLHPRRERDRGFNQAALLARAVAQGLGAEARPRALARTRATAPQARQLAAAARMANVAGAFVCREPVAGRDVVLVDDVATTGATLAACADALRAVGARSVRALVFARA